MYGDTAVIRQRASRLDHGSDDIRGHASSMISQAESVEWHSTAANAFRSKVSDRAHDMAASGQKLDAAAATLRTHAAEVDRVKAEIEQATQFVRSAWEATHSTVVNAVQSVGHAFEVFGHEVSQAAFDRAHDVASAVPSLPVDGDKQWLDVRDTFTARGWAS